MMKLFDKEESKKKSSEEFKNFSIKLTTEYLEQYSDQASRYCKTKDKQIDNIEKNFAKEILPTERTTVPDYLTSVILELAYHHEENQRDQIQKQYNDQKQTEMMIGELLERYIASKGKDQGWAFTGECIKAVDFIKKDNDTWKILQVKNSDNTENRDFIATKQILANSKQQYKLEFIDKIYKKNNLRLITGKEASRLQGFPEGFKIDEKDKLAKKQFGNAVPVSVVDSIIKELFKQDFLK